jgi:hypothetical protein
MKGGGIMHEQTNKQTNIHTYIHQIGGFLGI